MFPTRRSLFSSQGYNGGMTEIKTAEEAEDRLGMTDVQWAQWQAYTHGYGEQDANGIDLSCLRENLRLTPTERLQKHQRALRLFRKVHDAGIRAGLSRYSSHT